MKNFRIEAMGFDQGKANQLGDCCVCERPVQAKAAWFETSGYYEPETDCYCRRCVTKEVKRREAELLEIEQWTEDEFEKESV